MGNSGDKILQKLFNLLFTAKTEQEVDELIKKHPQAFGNPKYQNNGLPQLEDL